LLGPFDGHCHAGIESPAAADVPHRVFKPWILQQRHGLLLSTCVRGRLPLRKTLQLYKRKGVTPPRQLDTIDGALQRLPRPGMRFPFGTSVLDALWWQSKVGLRFGEEEMEGETPDASICSFSVHRLHSFLISLAHDWTP